MNFKKLNRISILVIIITILLCIIGETYTFTVPGSPDLLPGSSGDNVEKLQRKLKNWGYYEGDITGFYGVETFYAVKNFQHRYGLRATGIAEKNTLELLGYTTLASYGHAYAQGKSISDEQLLARAINGEARGEPYEGQVAVGAVILNRTRDPRFPHTIAGVIYQPGAFTAVSDGQINVPIDPNSTVVKAARDALNGWDPTGGCIYYWNPATATSKWIWSRQVVKQIGKHYFAK